MPTHLEDLEDELVHRPGRVVVLAGAGVSMATDPENPCAGWTGLLEHGLDWLNDRHSPPAPLLDGYRALSKQGELLPVATFLAGQLRVVREGEYADWLGRSVGALKVADARVIRQMADLGARLATTNYDSLIEQVSGKDWMTWRDAARVARFARGDSPDVFHIHGHYLRPETCVLDARSYEDVCRDEPTRNSLRALLTGSTLLLVGCGAGLSDPNFGSLLEWSRTALQHSPYTSYRLVRDAELDPIRSECRGLPIQPIAFGNAHADLGPFLERLADRVRRRRTPVEKLDTLSDQQSDYHSQCDTLSAQREGLAAGEYVRRRLTLARSLWAAGGRRTAALASSAALSGEWDRLSETERMEFGLEVADWLLQDDHARAAAEHLRRLATVTEVPGVSPDVVTRFRHLRVQCMNDLSAYAQTLEAIEQSLLHSMGDERLRLEAQRAEIRFLQGDVDEAARGLDGEAG